VNKKAALRRIFRQHSKTAAKKKQWVM